MKEKKVAPKFSTVFIDDNASAGKIASQLTKWCRAMQSSGLMPMAGGSMLGNLSIRCKKGSKEFIITPSGAGSKGGSSKDAYVRVLAVDIPGKKVLCRGKREPSSESMLHYLIYKKRKDVNAIFHGHSPEILKCAGRLGLPTTAKEEPYGTVALAERVLKIADSDLLVMKGHGFISLGRSANEAGKRAMKAYNECVKFIRSSKGGK